MWQLCIRWQENSVRQRGNHFKIIQQVLWMEQSFHIQWTFPLKGEGNSHHRSRDKSTFIFFSAHPWYVISMHCAFLHIQGGQAHVNNRHDTSVQILMEKASRSWKSILHHWVWSQSLITWCFVPVALLLTVLNCSAENIWAYCRWLIKSPLPWNEIEPCPKWYKITVITPFHVEVSCLFAERKPNNLSSPRWADSFDGLPLMFLLNGITQVGGLIDYAHRQSCSRCPCHPRCGEEGTHRIWGCPGPNPGPAT